MKSALLNKTLHENSNTELRTKHGQQEYPLSFWMLSNSGQHN
jgi:hypothetical protein